MTEETQVIGLVYLGLPVAFIVGLVLGLALA